MPKWEKIVESGRVEWQFGYLSAFVSAEFPGEPLARTQEFFESKDFETKLYTEELWADQLVGVSSDPVAFFGITRFLVDNMTMLLFSTVERGKAKPLLDEFAKDKDIVYINRGFNNCAEYFTGIEEDYIRACRATIRNKDLLLERGKQFKDVYGCFDYRYFLAHHKGESHGKAANIALEKFGLEGLKLFT